MTRRRKGSPQDSIDSILLAISRRDDISQETLSHYFDRLDEEWTDGARVKVLNLLRSSDSAAHAAAILILSELATDFDLEELEDFVIDPTVSDFAKLTLSPILKELGSDLADEGLVEYLNDPATAMQQMQNRLLEMVGRNEAGVEFILEDVTSMPLERRLGFISWLGNSYDPRAVALLLPLLEGQTGKVVIAALEALEQLGPVANQQTIPALNHLIATSSNRSVKQQARAVLGRLTMQGNLGDEIATDADRQQQFPLHGARISYIDGSGSQLIMLAWKRLDGLIKGVNVLYQDQWGVKDCNGVDEIEVESWNTLISNLDERGFNSFRVTPEYARSLIIEARMLNKRTRRKLPIAYSIWRPLIEGNELLKKQDISALALPDLPAVNADTRMLAQRGDELYQMNEFISWMYNPFVVIEPYILRYWTALQEMALADEGKRERGKSGKTGRKAPLKMQVQQTLLDELTQEALNALINDEWRKLYVTRLRRQAVLFRMAERTREVTLVEAVAAVLQPDSQVPLAEQSFPRALIRLTIENGLFRVLTNSFYNQDLVPMPVDIMDKEV